MLLLVFFLAVHGKSITSSIDETELLLDNPDFKKLKVYQNKTAIRSDLELKSFQISLVHEDSCIKD